MSGTVRLAETTDRSRPSDQHRRADAPFHRVSVGQDFIDAIEARIGAEVAGRLRQRMRETRRRRAVAKGSPRSRARSSSSARCRRTCRGGRVVELDPLDPQPSGASRAGGRVRRAHLLRRANMSSAASPRPTSTSHARSELGVAIEDCVIIEDSPVGATGAVASGAEVIGLAAGSHCFDDHADMLRALGVAQVAHSFDEIARMVGLAQPSR